MSQTSPFCDTCGASNPSTSQFCHACGQALLHHLTPTGSLPTAHLLQQRYRVIKKLGQGGFGAIYLVEDAHFPGAFRALKEMRNQYLSLQERHDTVAAFQHEARLLATLMHPHLPRVYDSFEENGRWYLTMDYIDGETLQERLLKTPHGIFLAREVLPLALQLCAALGYLHSHQPPVIFRDMKPANVMVNGQDHLYLIDFGIARFFKPGQGKDTVALGSVGYAAPEQYGKAQSSTTSDIYGLGATLHYLLSGDDPSEHPFTFSPLKIHPQDVPYAHELADLIQQMVQIPVEKRPGSIQEIRQQLQRMEQHTQSSGAPLVPSAIHTPVSPPLKETSIPEVEETLYILQGEKETIDPHVPCTLAWLPDSQHLVCGGYRLLACWDITTQIATPIIESTLTFLTCSPDGVFLAMQEFESYKLSMAGSVFLLNLRTYERILATTHQDPSLDDLRQHGAWERIDFGTPLPKNAKRSVGISLLAKGEEPSALALSPNGETLAVGTTKGVVYLWDVRRKCLTGSCQAHSKAVTALSWSPNGSKFVSGGEDTEIHILAMSKRVQRFKGERNILEIQVTSKEYRHIIRVVAWSPDGEYIAVAGEMGGVLLCDTSGRLKLSSSYWRIFSINTLCWSPDSKSLAVTGYDNTISIWKIQEQSNFWEGKSWIIKRTFLQCVGIYSKHRNWIYAAQWSPDGKYIASCDAFRTVHVWKAPVFSLCSTGPVTATPCPVRGQPVTITYHGRLTSNATSLTVHWGYNYWNGITDTSMIRQSNNTWSAIITLPAGATTLNIAFFNQSNTWDNNMGHNYDLDVL